MVAALCFGMTACMDKDYDEPDFSKGAPYGNNNIEATNVVTIRQLKEMYSTVMTTDFRDGDSYTEVTTDLQIRGFVTANDVSGNIYNEVAIQDETVTLLLNAELKRTPVVQKPENPQNLTTNQAGDGSTVPQHRKAKQDIGRNDPCPCGSGKKYKNCCGKK